MEVLKPLDLKHLFAEEAPIEGDEKEEEKEVDMPEVPVEEDEDADMTE